MTEKVMSEKSIKDKAEEILLNIFLCLFGVYLLFRDFEITTFYLPVPEWFLKYLFLAMTGLALIRILLRPEHWKLYILPAVCASVYALVYLRLRYWSVLYIGLLTVGFRGVEYKRILKVFTACLAAFLLVTFTAAILGGIENFVYLKDGYIRSSWGIGYPTDMASLVLFLLMLSWVAWDWMADSIALILGILSIWFCKYIAMSVTSTGCSALFVGVVLSHLLYKKVPILHKIPNIIKNFAKGGLIFSFPLLALLMLGLMFAYIKGIGPAYRINNILSNRIQYAVEAYHEHGINLCGNLFTMTGNGGSTFTTQEYNFIDSSYPLILIRYGLLLFITICVTWTYSMWRAVRNNDWQLVGVMFLIGVHSFSEHHFIEANYNILLTMPFALYPTVQNAECRQRETIWDNGDKGRHVIATGACGLLIILFIVLAGPHVLSAGRTVVDILGWKDSVYGRRWLILLLVQAYGLLAICMAGMYGLIMSLGKNKRKAIVCGSLIIISTILTFGGMRWEDRVINQGNRKYSMIVSKDTEGLKDVFSLAEGKVYVDRAPEVYREAFPQISTSVFKGDDLARLYDSTVIMDIDYDSNCFINSGFLFTPISECSAIYTNDLSVIHGMQEKGYHVTGYYSVEKEINLKKLAQQNNLMYSGAEIHLNGKEKAITNGPDVSLYSGPYTVTYELKSGKDYSADDLLGTLRITAYDGDKQLNELKIYGKDFDNDGESKAELSLDSAGYRDVDFLAVAEPGSAFDIRRLTYRRTPEYDIHSLYNRKRKKYRDEYYSLTGEAIQTAEGYFACEYEYNEDGVITEIRHFDKFNQPIVTKKGYARIVRGLNNKNQITKESYYGADGQPIEMPQGYYIFEREYDEAGNAIVQRYCDAEGNPVMTTFGYAEVRQEYDEKKQPIKDRYYDAEGQPQMMPQGYYGAEREYDNVGNTTVIRYCDASGNLVMTTYGYAEIHKEYNGKRQVVRESYYGADGQPIEMPQGYYIFEREYDEAGNAIVQRYCDAEGNPVMTTFGYAEVRQEYDEKKQPIKDRYYDAEGQPQMMPQGYYGAEREYDNVGNTTVIRYCDASGNLVMTTYGYAEIHKEYNGKRQVVRESYYGADGQPIEMPQGYYIFEREYDEAGNAIVQRYCDAEGNPVMTTFGYAEVRQEYDEKKQPIKDRYYDAEGQPQMMPQGYYGAEREYDNVGNTTVIRYCDASGNLVMTTYGYAEIHKEYNGKRQVVRESYYGADGQPIEII